MMHNQQPSWSGKAGQPSHMQDMVLALLKLVGLALITLPVQKPPVLYASIAGSQQERIS